MMKSFIAICSYFVNNSGYFEDIYNRGYYIEYIADIKSIQYPEQWYKVKSSELLPYGGNRLLRNYDHSVYHALKDCFPDYEWQPWRFSSLSSNIIFFNITVK
jgi:hypothetical protein